MLTGSAGRARVAAVAEEIGWSRRYPGSRFAAEFGITLEDAARPARFEYSHRLLRTVATGAASEGVIWSFGTCAGVVDAE